MALIYNTAWTQDTHSRTVYRRAHCHSDLLLICTRKVIQASSFDQPHPYIEIAIAFSGVSHSEFRTSVCCVVLRSFSL